MLKPKISLICPSYNHKKYIKPFINSILVQSERNFELIIIDDASTDGNLAEISDIKDARIKIFKNDYNRGVNFCITKACAKAKADIIAFTPSDDIYSSRYIELILKEFKNKKSDVVFIAMEYIDEKGRLLPGSWDLPVNKTQREIFVDYFLRGPQLPTNGMSFKKSVIAKLLPLDYGVLQYSDTQLHSNFLFRNKITMLNSHLIYTRISKEAASARRSDVSLRESIETEKLMNTFVNLIGENTRVFNNFFGGHPLVKNQKITPKTIPFWLARIAMTAESFEKKSWGYKKIMEFISSGKNSDLLHKEYKFDFGQYLNLGKIIADLNPSVKLKKYRKRFQRLLLIFIVFITLSALSLLLLF